MEDYQEHGMQPASSAVDLRDYFAAKALLGFICEPVEGIQAAIYTDLSDKTCDAFAAAAYQMAEAMLKERVKWK
jgi:hypothetical protein